MRTVQFIRRREEWLVRGVPRKGGVEGELVLLRQELPNIRATDLRAALENHCDYYDIESCEVAISDAPEGYFDPDDGGGPVDLRFAEGELGVGVLHFGRWPADGQEQTLLDQLATLLQPLMADHRAVLRSVEADDWYSNDEAVGVRLRFTVPWRGRSVEQLVDAGDDVLRLCDAFDSGAITRESVADLLRGGCAQLLIGQPEGNWLEVKAQEYDLSTEAGCA